MNCTNCNTPNTPGEQFCIACGSELMDPDLTIVNPRPATSPAVVDTTSAPVPTPAPAVAVAPVSPAAATLNHNGAEYTLATGGKLVIARQGSDKCRPDIGIPSDTVSSVPIEVTEQNGEIVVRDTGTPGGIQVAIYIPPGGSFKIKPGDWIIPGMGEVIIVQ